ncbi:MULTISPECIES: ABC transporter permease [unclassified Halanaerobium]|uniref:ABC transporter permease n=1 Tax=unclassified Halanaerobium TaxID=2641197 RepID=UPI000DF15571|nr:MULTISPECIES: ABC transporter permease [unclassified Halanaerobium]RCW50678.1 peptide/nickel transport system permease protein [Halanaerobium sp. MA284_MarDTE_T2]RCW86846.1 peptide/nickel transport system permease protein [Halanaerobium sp. DL-01]
MKKKVISSIFLIIQLYINYQNWIVKNKIWNSLELKAATLFSVFVILLLMLIIFKSDLFSSVKENDLFQKTWKEFNKNLGGKIAAVMLLCIFYAAFMAPFIAPYSPLEIDYSNMNYSPPSAAHWFGTDDFGRDIFSRVLYGTRIALGIGFSAVFLNALLGITLGLLAGYYGGKTDMIIMRLVEIWNSIPFILLALAIIAALGKGMLNLIIAVGVTGLINFSRLTRSIVLQIKEKEYIAAAKALGSSDIRILYKHILPNSISSLIVLGTLRIGISILVVAGLSFLGLGIQPPTPSWGTMLNRGQEFLTSAPWMSIFPGLAIIITVLSFNLLGDALRDALDPRQLD